MSKREDPDADELAVLKAMLLEYIRQSKMCEELGMAEDDVMANTMLDLELGLIEIIRGPEDEDGNFEFAIVPTEKGLAATGGR